MSRRRRIALAVVVAAQLAVPLGTAALAEADLAFGREIRLLARPVDPFDVFRGNYVALRYTVSELPTPYDTAPGDRLCTRLYKDGDVWSGSYALPDHPNDGVVLCGRATRAVRAGDPVGIEYGIETHYASAERAREIEDALARGRVYAVIDLDDDGSARLERLELERVATPAAQATTR